MTQLYDGDGVLVGVTVLAAGPCVVVQCKETSRDGYQALQLGLVETRPPKHVTKPMQGHFKRADVAPLRVLREFLTPAGAGDLKAGDQVGVDMFEVGDQINVTGTTKGKGFQGVIRRHGFSGGKASHGSMFHRAPGSIGQSAYPSRVFKGIKLPGQTGSKQRTTRGLTVVGVDSERNLLLVKGSVPGAKGSYLKIYKAGGA